MKIDRIELDSELYQKELDLRYRILRKPIGMTKEQVCSPVERQCDHFVMNDEEHVYGCVLLHRESATSGRLLQMAVDKSLQGNGLGARLVSALEAYAASVGITSVVLHSRQVAAGFYERLGYETFGEPFNEVGIRHVIMRKCIQ